METIPKEERLWAVLAHLSAFAMYLTGIGHLLGPLIVWLAKREGRPFVEDQAKEALNFQISFTIYTVAAIALCFTIIGLVVALPALWLLPIFHIICMVIAAIKAHDGVAFRYPLTLRLIK
jgi:uncharacterized Tic20 family protein